MKKVATKKSVENIFFALFLIFHFLKKWKIEKSGKNRLFTFFKKWEIEKSAKKIFSADFFVATFFITAKPYLLFYGFFIMPICQFQWKWLWWTVTWRKLKVTIGYQKKLDYQLNLGLEKYNKLTKIKKHTERGYLYNCPYTTMLVTS